MLGGSTAAGGGGVLGGETIVSARGGNEEVPPLGALVAGTRRTRQTRRLADKPLVAGAAAAAGASQLTSLNGVRGQSLRRGQEGGGSCGDRNPPPLCQEAYRPSTTVHRWRSKDTPDGMHGFAGPTARMRWSGGRRTPAPLSRKQQQHQGEIQMGRPAGSSLPHPCQSRLVPPGAVAGACCAVICHVVERAGSRDGPPGATAAQLKKSRQSKRQDFPIMHLDHSIHRERKCPSTVSVLHNKARDCSKSMPWYCSKTKDNEGFNRTLLDNVWRN